MTQFLLSVHHDYSRPLHDPGADLQALFAAVAAFNHDVQEAGAWVLAGGLEAPSTAFTVSVADGDTAVTEGPAADGRLQMGGFWVLELPDVESAVTWAQRASIATGGPVEVRPFQAT